MSGLFRREALEQRQARRFGSPLAIAPLSFKLFTAFVLLIVAAIGCFLYWGTYTNKQTVTGYILPSKGLITLYAPQRGTLVARYTHLGETVHKGEPLYKITLQRSTQTTANVNAALMKNYDTRIAGIRSRSRLAKSLETTKIAQLRSQQHDLQLESRRLQDQLKTQRAILALAKKNYSRYRTLAHTGMVSQSDLQKQRHALLTQQATVEQLEQSAVKLHDQLDQIPGQMAATRSNTADSIANYKNQLAQLEQQKLQLQSQQQIVVRAPNAGVISSVMAKVGLDVNTQTPLVSLLPQGSIFQARLLVPTTAIGFVHTGEPVVLRYSAFPYQQFGLYHGHVREVSRSIIAPRELNLPVSLKQPYYLVTAALDKPYVLAYGRHMPLAAGMTLSADIVINRERLYEWVLRPIQSLRGHL